MRTNCAERSSLMLCSSCSERRTCSSPCAALNKYLKDNGIYSADWIRPEMNSSKRNEGLTRNRETPVADIDSVAIQRALQLRGGKKKIKKYAETE